MVKNSIDGCDTSLVLGLGSTKRSIPLPDLHRRSNPSFKQEPSISIPSPIEPRFTHGCQDDGYGSRNFSPDVRSLVQQQSSSLTTVSSFSNKPTSKEVNEDEEGSLRKKLRLTKEQSSFLEERFKEHTTLNPKQKQALANQLNLRPRQVEVWFQNRRARTKMKQNEAEVELLRRYFETLADENRRLKKELQELKTTKLSSPWFATLCPKCERAAMGVDGSKSGNFKSTVGMGKHQLFNHFAHSSAT